MDTVVLDDPQVHAKAAPEKRILIVDDEPFNLKSLKIMIEVSLKLLGMDSTLLDNYIDVATDGVQAITQVENLFYN